MAQSTNQQFELDSKCVKARPWVRRFVEDHKDGSPWGYAIFEDPTIDEEVMEECMCRIDTLLWFAKDAVFGRGHEEFPSFKWEVLDWPEGGDEGDGDGQQGDGERPAEEDSNGDGGEDGAGAEDDEGEGTERDEVDGDQEGEDEDNEDDEDDADIELVRELPRLRAHFKWVRERAKKRRKAHESLDVDRSGIPHGLVRNVFLVIDQDAIDSIVASSPMADLAWVWAVDPEYISDMVSMTKNGLKDEYYGYMRVRVQQLANNFWDTRRYHEDDLPLPVLWEAAKQSHNCAFVSVDPQEAQVLGGSMNSGSALRAPTG